MLTRFLGWTLLFAALSSFSTTAARAQRLVAALESPVPFHIDGTPIGPVEEHGALLVFGDDLETRAARSMRIDATSVTAGPGLASNRVADVIACGGSRWLVELADRDGRARWSVGVDGAPAAWSRMSPADVEVRCVAGRVVVGHVQDGELVTQVLSPAVQTPRRVRVGPRGSAPEISWVSPAIDELDVVVQSPVAGSTRLLRVLAGTVTHRRDLGRTTSATLALGARAVLVATGNPDGRGSTLRSFARADLAPGPSSTVSGEAGHATSVTGLWPGPRDLVAVAVVEGWSGPDYVARSQGPDRRHRYEPARHHTSSLRLWAPATGAIGDATDIGESDPRTAAWLGGSLVLVSPVYAAEVVRDEVRLGPARVRRYSVAP